MRDIFLKADTREALDDHLATHDIIIQGNYYQDDSMIIDWIGKVPRSVNQDGEVTEWYSGYRFNVRLIDESVNIFSVFTEVSPDIPYRVFS